MGNSVGCKACQMNILMIESNQKMRCLMNLSECDSTFYVIPDEVRADDEGKIVIMVTRTLLQHVLVTGYFTMEGDRRIIIIKSEFLQRPQKQNRRG